MQEGFSLQLGLIGLIAAEDGFKDISGNPERFEYWSLAKSKDKDSLTGFGYSTEPIKEGKKKTGLPREEFLSRTDRKSTRLNSSHT